MFLNRHASFNMLQEVVKGLGDRGGSFLHSLQGLVVLAGTLSSAYHTVHRLCHKFCGIHKLFLTGRVGDGRCHNLQGENKDKFLSILSTEFQQRALLQRKALAHLAQRALLLAQSFSAFSEELEKVSNSDVKYYITSHVLKQHKPSNKEDMMQTATIFSFLCYAFCLLFSLYYSLYNSPSYSFLLCMLSYNFL